MFLYDKKLKKCFDDVVGKIKKKTRKEALLYIVE